MMFPWWGIMPMFYPMLPNDCNRPPTIYSLLDSIVNYNSEVKTPIKDLAKLGRNEIFNFDYPLTSNITKEDFEVMILNNYMMRRIGYETLTAFRLALNVKLNSIMPIYNKMFDSLKNWNILEDGEIIEREVEKEDSSTGTNTSSNTNQLSSTSRDDTRYSDTPQGRLTDVENGTYMTDYTLNQNTSTGNSTNTQNGSESKQANGTETERISRTPINKIEIYKEFQNELKSIYELIFNELDDLFYSLI